MNLVGSKMVADSNFCHCGLSWCVEMSADKYLTWTREEMRDKTMYLIHILLYIHANTSFIISML